MTGNYYNEQQPEYYESQPTSTQSSFGERPFQRRSVDDNSNYWSNNKEYSTPNYSRQDMTWNNQQQQAYRQSKFNRDPQWPKRQNNYGGGVGKQENYYYSDSQSRFGRKGAGGGGQQGIDDHGKQQYTEDFHRGSSSSTLSLQQGYGKEILERQQQQEPYYDAKDFRQRSSSSTLSSQRFASRIWKRESRMATTTRAIL